MPAARFSPAAEGPASLATSQVVVFSIMASAVADSSLQDFIDLTLGWFSLLSWSVLVVVELLLSLDPTDGDDFFESKFCKTLAYDVMELTDVAEVEAATLAAAPPGEISSLYISSISCFYIYVFKNYNNK
uniref:Uncharacterized protein n=1 Tax=Glossina austeni TaxID=7395 RepID=A0A1A9UFN7_GLOAU